MNKIKTSQKVGVLIAATGLAIGCAMPDSSTDSQTSGARVESQHFQIAINELPAAFEIQTNDESGLVLTASPAGSGLVTFGAGPVTVGGINLVAATRAAKEAIEAQPNGHFFGNQELVTPLGSVFTSRGSYQHSEEAIEELQAFALHPTSNRLLTISYQYPPGEGAERAQDFIFLIGEIGPLGPAEAEVN